MKKVINAYFSGTSFEIEKDSFIASQLYGASISADNQINFGFDGCGIAHDGNGSVRHFKDGETMPSLSGALWGTGLDEQCQKVIEQIKTELKAGHQVTLNAYGHSRGAIAALLLAKQLGQVDPNLLEINLALLDPVPGNLITTSALDFLNISLANKVMDLSECTPLKNVLAIYPYIPLSDISCHAPLFPIYPSSANVDEDTTFGCHAQAEVLINHGISASAFTAPRFYEFLTKHGSKFKLSEQFNFNFMWTNDELLQLYDNHHSEVNASTRAAHSPGGRHIETRSSVKCADIKYVNRHHQQLAGVEDDPAMRLTSIKPAQGLVARLRQVTESHPVASDLIKWCLIGAVLTAVCFSTAGFAAVPLVTTLVANLGFASTFLGTSVLLAAGAATSWKYMAFPTLTWAAERFYYPYYKNLIIEPNAQNDIGDISSSHTQLAQKISGQQELQPNSSFNLVSNDEDKISEQKESKGARISRIKPFFATSTGLNSLNDESHSHTHGSAPGMS